MKVKVCCTSRKRGSCAFTFMGRNAPQKVVAFSRFWIYAAWMLARFELEKAVKENSVERMMEAIANGATVEERGYRNEPLLYVAMKAGALEAGRKLIQLGADVNERVGCDKDTLLIKAARTSNPAFLWLLLQNKADHTLGNRYGKTALAYCVDTDYMARDLREAGCFSRVGSRYAEADTRESLAR